MMFAEKFVVLNLVQTSKQPRRFLKINLEEKLDMLIETGLFLLIRLTQESFSMNYTSASKVMGETLTLISVYFAFLQKVQKRLRRTVISYTKF